ncbi:BZIP transcription factor [Paragonimus heterotremus]|uniref:BZIP transcription factor n=1 Tax=Paragonimus heterotremus TaxID=100268 RepID=A0A8J4T171_9TREM|nr:BZIP transcription factor [Paragonimus heterotremus]
MENQPTTDNSSAPNSVSDTSSETAVRPTTLNILLDNGLKSPLLPSFLTPSLEELPPVLRTEVEKLLQQWKSSPQTPGSFLNPKHVTDEQERFANAFTQKLNELQDANCLASIATALSPAALNSSSLYNVTLPEITAQNLPNFAELCRQAVQQQSGLSNPPILLYSSGSLNAHALAAAHTKNSTNMSSQQSSVFEDAQTLNDVNLQNSLKGSVSLTLPTTALSLSNKEMTTLQLPNGMKFEITTNGGVTPASVLKLLGINTASNDLPRTSGSETNQSSVDSLFWPLQVQPPAANEVSHVEGTYPNLLASPRNENDTRPSSVANSLDQAEISRPIRSASSVSSSSSISQTAGKETTSNFKDTRLDPIEQYRMRLERKRARNRDAARKCRERKIRLIKSLEKDVLHLSEENKTLRNRLSRSKFEVERLKLFVANHLEKECSAISSKVV